jgi:hypothetical protein
MGGFIARGVKILHDPNSSIPCNMQPPYYNPQSINQAEFDFCARQWSDIARGGKRIESCPHQLHRVKFYSLVFFDMRERRPEINESKIHSILTFAFKVVTTYLSSSNHDSFIQSGRAQAIAHNTTKLGIRVNHIFSFGGSFLQSILVLLNDCEGSTRRSWSKVISEILRAIIPILLQQDENISVREIRPVGISSLRDLSPDDLIAYYADISFLAKRLDDENPLSIGSRVSTSVQNSLEQHLIIPNST